MSELQPSLKARARWITRHQLAHINPWRKHIPGVHTRATGFLPFSVPARTAEESQQASAPLHPHPAQHVIPAAAAEAAARCDDHIDTGHLLLALFRADDEAAAQVLAGLGAGESPIRGAITELLDESGPERSG
jgi:hypothetical protein